ncbi:putative lysozyme [Xanthomonas phage P4]|uniref:Endolysin n=2 Tax=Pradovirus TaxID=1985733 RepID=A0AAE9VLT0_9CAUD|nr:putative lysozyme [Xanthomonas phage F5]WAX24111.1 putative lysozyme [Xanthomonas phage GF2]WAX24117.1 putative lysozyme [Xanthomonas phage GF1]WAX24161.1 putative lysozyme [Xanthomonas phage P4]WAX24251.1 putative lysozyme [Xanthomonas phage S3]
MNQQQNQDTSNKGLFGLIGGIFIGISATLLSFTQGHEGVRYAAYLDTGRVPTICYGHTKGVAMGMTATKAQCDKWLIEDLQIAQQGVRKHLKAPVNRNQIDAYTDFVFNVGEKAFADSTMLRKANAGDREGSCKEFLRWVYVGKLDCRLSSSRCSGIPKRRDAEFALCLRPNNEVIQPWKPQVK